MIIFRLNLISRFKTVKWPLVFPFQTNCDWILGQMYRACQGGANSSISCIYVSFLVIQRGFFPGGSDGKESACNAGDLCSKPGSGRSPGEGNGYPLQYSCLENSMDRGAWWAMGSQRVRHDWVTNTFTFFYHSKIFHFLPFYCLGINIRNSIHKEEIHIKILKIP